MSEPRILSRVDESGEFLSMYFKSSAPISRGLTSTPKNLSGEEITKGSFCVKAEEKDDPDEPILADLNWALSPFVAVPVWLDEKLLLY